MEQFSRFVTRMNNALGLAASWLCLIIVLLQVVIVLNRYCFGYSSLLGLDMINYEEALLYAFSAIFLFGASYTYNCDGHVRVDIVYAALKPRNQKKVDLFGNIVLLLPLTLLILVKSNRNLDLSWTIAEGSVDGGLPYVYLWQSMLPVFAISLSLQGVANFIRLSLEVFGKSRTVEIALAVSVICIFGWVFFTALGWSTDANWTKPDPAWRFAAYTFGVWLTRGLALGACLWALIAVFNRLKKSSI